MTDPALLTESLQPSVTELWGFMHCAMEPDNVLGAASMTVMS